MALKLIIGNFIFTAFSFVFYLIGFNSFNWLYTVVFMFEILIEILVNVNS